MKLNLEFYKGEDKYSDGDIESEILELFKQKPSEYEVEQYFKKDNRWPILYHLSPVRKNLLDWVDFDPEASLLEIGAGCGALTGLLASRVKSVTSVELSKRRGEIILERHSSCENIEVVIGNFQDIKFDKKFDYVVIVGVLEYSQSFINSPKPYEEFLRDIRKLLTDKGVIVIAIENKLGIKYFAGAKEDHTGGYFDGIEGYISSKNVKTFGRAEIGDLLLGTGFSDLQYYYPYPDYKLPYTVFSDRYLPDISTDLGGSPNYDQERLVLFNEKAAYLSIIKNNLFGEFSNSFLVFAGAGKSSATQKTIFAKYGNRRLPQYRIATQIIESDKTRTVVKKSLHPLSVSHISLLADRSVEDRLMNSPKITSKLEESVTFEFVDGETMDLKISKAFFEGDYEALYNYIDNFSKLLKKIYYNVSDDVSFETLKTEFLYESLSKEEFEQLNSFCTNANLDLVFDNILVNNEITSVIDSEWVVDFPVPVLFLLFRGIYTFEQKFHQLNVRIGFDFESLYERFGIDSVTRNIFIKMQNDFQKHVIGDSVKYLDNYSQKIYPLDHLLSAEKYAIAFNNALSDIRKLEKTFNKQMDENKRLSGEIDTLKQNIRNIENSKVWRLAEKFRKMKRL